MSSILFLNGRVLGKITKNIKNKTQNIKSCQFTSESDGQFKSYWCD